MEQCGSGIELESIPLKLSVDWFCDLHKVASREMQKKPARTPSSTMEEACIGNVNYLRKHENLSYPC